MPYITEGFIPEHKKTSVALGNFDGLHRGHMAVIEATKRSASDAVVPVVLKFREHPGMYLGAEQPLLLMTAQEEEKRLHAIGVQTAYYHFPDVRMVKPRSFVEDILIGEMHADYVSCGFNYRFGVNACADAQTLRSLCSEYGIRCEICPAVCRNGETVSSSGIRKALSEGDIRRANDLLGYTYSYDYVVVTGDRRGRLLGAPTINQFFPEQILVPKYGVYASVVTINGKRYAAVTNIGMRPTIGNSSPRSETYIKGFDGDLYGKRPTVSLLEYMRPEIHFSNLDALSEQIAADAEKAAVIAGV